MRLTTEPSLSPSRSLLSDFVAVSKVSLEATLRGRLFTTTPCFPLGHQLRTAVPFCFVLFCFV